MATLLLQHEPTLVTTGDAISSWLRYPDQATASRCLQSAKTMPYKAPPGRRLIRKSPAVSRLIRNVAHIDGLPLAACHKYRAIRWHQAVNRRRWATCLTLCIIPLVVAGILLGVAMYGIRGDEPVLALGFGAITSRTIIATRPPTTDTSGLILNVLVANLPQLIFSCLYLLYNGILTSMCLAHEYSNYSIRRKSLRVTSPHGDQRSTYWLNLPYIYSIPLLAISALLH